MECRILGMPVQEGSRRLGCDMGPSALRAAGLIGALRELGHQVTDLGTLAPAQPTLVRHPNGAIAGLPEVVAWIHAIGEAAYRAADGATPIFLGGDHSMAAGTIPAMAARAAEQGRPLFLVWLDAHMDFHTLDTTVSGNLHGVPLAYVSGQPGFSDYFPALAGTVAADRICALGIRSVDPAERTAVAKAGAIVHDMRAIDEHGIVALLRPFLNRVVAENGLLHVSLDVDFLDPAIAPGVGTTVPGGATFREAHLVMEMLSDSGRVGSLDLAELNPFLDERGRTATLMVDLAASLMGRRIMDRPTRSY
jgi:arginase